MEKLTEKQLEMVIIAKDNSISTHMFVKQLRDLGLVKREEIKLGNWYFQDGNMFYASVIGNRAISGVHRVYGYGFDDGEWEDLSNTTTGGWTFVPPETPFRLATKEEVEEALRREAKKRGFVKGVKFRNFQGKIQTITREHHFSNLGEGYNGLCCGGTPEEEWNKEGCSSNAYIFNNGKWAEIIEEPKTIKVTIEEIQEKFGSKVEIIESK